jgi:ATP-dependent DNA helicase RecQ
VPDFAGRLAEALGVPYLDLVERVDDRPPQREMQNSSQQAANVRDAFALLKAPPPDAGLLVDDQWFSGWTLTTIGALLRDAASGPVYPLVLALAGA